MEALFEEMAEQTEKTNRVIQEYGNMLLQHGRQNNQDIEKRMIEEMARTTIIHGAAKKMGRAHP
ncbi:MAG: hypothetical protein WB791_02635 [Waddliaceae bacterium]